MEPEKQIKPNSSLDPPPGCCYYYCFLNGGDDSKPWYNRHCFGNTIFWIGIIPLGILVSAAILAVIGAFLFGSGYIGNSVLKFRDIYGVEMNCLKVPVKCGLFGFIYWLLGCLSIVLVNGAFLPLHLLVYRLTKNVKILYMIIVPCLMPICVFGPPLIPALVHPDSVCNINSYYGFMNWACMLFGILALLCIGVGWCLIWGIVFLISCLIDCKKKYDEKIRKTKESQPSDIVVV